MAIHTLPLVSEVAAEDPERGLIVRQDIRANTACTSYSSPRGFHFCLVTSRKLGTQVEKCRMLLS